ncbi:hypothetical protein PAMP_006516 [Pampus punctatissimus]
MSGDQPPPYVPHPQGGPVGFPPAFSSPPGTFPGSPYQAYPAQTHTGGDPCYYQGPPGHQGPSGPCMTQPGYQSYQGGPHGHWDGHSPCEHPPKHTVFLVERDRGDEDDGAGDCLSACSAALCCCCLWDMLTHDLC